jgi:DNA-nicking Smr family endonuclease
VIKQEAPRSVFPAALAEHRAGRAPGLDRRSALRLKRGKTDIDGKIDLHGMTQAQARSALSAFVTSGHRHGRRCLLVITGKGRRPTTGSEAPRGSEPGVLRRAVPNWLEASPMVACVLAYSPAQPEHGGYGALYVLLKRRRDQ